MLIFQPPIICCVLGAISVQFIQFIEAANLPRKRKPDYRSFQFYMTVLFSLAIAGIVGYIYFDGDVAHSKIVYFHTGVSAPLLVKKLYARIPAAVRLKE
jgi:hypothetical protein